MLLFITMTASHFRIRLGSAVTPSENSFRESFSARMPLLMAERCILGPWLAQNTFRERKCADTVGRARELGWPFPVLKCTHILHIKYIKQFYQTALETCCDWNWQNADYGFKKFSFCVIYYNFPHTSVSCVKPYAGSQTYWAHTHACTRTHTHPFNSLCPGLPGWAGTRKVKPNLDFTEARDSEWQWHQLGHMQVCTSLPTDNHASPSPLSFFTGRMPFLPPNQQCQSTEGNIKCQTYRAAWPYHYWTWSKWQHCCHRRHAWPYFQQHLLPCETDVQTDYFRSIRYMAEPSTGPP